MGVTAGSKAHTTIVAAVKTADFVTTLQKRKSFHRIFTTNDAFIKLHAGTTENEIGLAKIKVDKPNQISICPLWCPRKESNLHTLANGRF